MNLHHIESRPSIENKNTYDFFVACDNARGGLHDAVDNLKEQTTHIQVMSRNPHKHENEGIYLVHLSFLCHFHARIKWSEVGLFVVYVRWSNWPDLCGLLFHHCFVSIWCLLTKISLIEWVVSDDSGGTVMVLCIIAIFLQLMMLTAAVELHFECFLMGGVY